jgi:ferritin
MISKKMSSQLNEQVKHEFNASHSYLAMACFFDGMELKALAARFHEQADEERAHALKLVHYLGEVGAKVKLTALAEPKAAYESPADLIATALNQEIAVTAQINALVDLAITENDHATRSYLQWFVDEQVEEVSSMEHLLAIAKMAGDDLLHLDTYVRHMLKAEGEAADSPTA